MKALPLFVILLLLVSTTYAQSGKNSAITKSLNSSNNPSKKSIQVSQNRQAQNQQTQIQQVQNQQTQNQQLQSQQVQTASSSVSKREIKKTQSSFSMTPSIQGTSSAVTHSDGTDRRSIDLGLYSTYSPNENWTFNLVIEGSQNLVDSEKSDFSTLFLQTSIYPQKISPSFKITPNFNLGFPASRKAREVKGLLIAPGPSVTFSLNPVSVPKLKTWFAIGLTKNFYKYEMGLDDVANIDYSSRQTLSITFNFTKKFYFYSEFHHINRVDYYGVASEGFESKEEFNYAFVENYLAWIGHSNNGSIFMPDGSSSNVKLYDENQSNVYGGLGVTLKF